MPGGGIGELERLAAGSHAFLGNRGALYLICRPIRPIKTPAAKLPGQGRVIGVGLKLASRTLIGGLGAFGKNFVPRIISQQDMGRRQENQERKAHPPASRPNFYFSLFIHVPMLDPGIGDLIHLPLSWIDLYLAGEIKLEIGMAGNSVSSAPVFGGRLRWR
jgi:hypothetical protein